MAADEIWKDIPRFNGQYQASNLGGIRRMFVTTRHGTISYKNYYPKIYFNSDGYQKNLIQKKLYSTHRLIAETFIPNFENKPQVNHINGIKSDNNINNLEWCTLQENINHFYEKTLINRNKVLTEKQINEIKSLYGKLSNRNLAKLFNVSRDTIDRKTKELRI